MKELLSKVLATIEKYDMLQTGDRVLVSVSGGADSMFLLWSLNVIADFKNLELMVAHLNHCIREGGEEEADFVRIQSNNLGIPCTVETVDVRSYCCNNRLSLEEGARELRYEFLHRVATQFGLNKITTGHTASDQLETFILRVARGCGSRGLLSIPPKREINQNSKNRVEVIRPLIELDGDEIREFLDTNKIPYCVDESNYDSSNIRNFVRQHVVPQLKRVAPDFSTKVNRLRDILEAEEEILDKFTEDRLKEIQDSHSESEITFDLEEFLAIPLPIKRRILRKIKNCPSFDEVENAIKYIESTNTGKEFEFGNVKIAKGSGKIRVANSNSGRLQDYKIELPIPGEVEVNGYKIRCDMHDATCRVDYEDKNKVYFDLDKLSLPLYIRNRKNGDMVEVKTQESKVVHKRLKEVFIDDKLPVWKRQYIPLLVDGDGILWIIGHRRAHRALVKKGTNKIVVVWIKI